MNESAPPAGRRPLKTRQWPCFQRLADRLAKSGVSPNAISASSVLFAASAGVALASTSWCADTRWERISWLAAAVLIQLRLVANLLDGMVAIEGGQESAVGELYNEVPDRLSDPVILIGAGLAAGSHTVLGWVAALTALFVAYVRAIGAGVGAGQVFLGPMAKPQRMALVTAACVYSAVAPHAWQPRWYAESSVIAAALILIIVGGALTAARRILRIAGWMKNHVDSE